MTLLGFAPTPVEEAYAYYLYQGLFGAPTVFVISGRDAVVALQQTQLARGTLRHLWSLVDPSTQGRLTQYAQWQLLLRLVALCQQGANPQGVEQWVGQSNHQPALATFSSVTIPPMDVLQQYHLQYQQVVSTATTVAPSPVPPPSDIVAPAVMHDTTLAGFDALDALGPSMDAPLPSLGSYASSDGPGVDPVASNDIDLTTTNQAIGGETVQQEGASNGFPPQDMVLNDPIPEPSGMDAFDALGPSMDAPLPSRESHGELKAAASIESHPQPMVESEPHGMMAISMNGPGSDAPPSSEQDAATPEDDDFRDTAGKTPVQAPPVVDGFNQDAHLQSFGMDAFDALGLSMDAPLPSLSQKESMGAAVTAPVVVPSVMEEAEDGFGDFNEANEPLPATGVDVFDSIRPSADPPLRSLGSMILQESHPVAGHEPGNSPDDVFGDFGGAEVAGAQPDAVSVDAPAPSLGMGAFDAMRPAVNATLPSLSQGPILSREDGQSTSPAAIQPEANDDFGDFADAQELQAPEPELSNPSPFDTPNITASTSNNDSGFNADAYQQSFGLDALDTLGPVADAPLPSLSQISAPSGDQSEDKHPPPVGAVSTDDGDFARTETQNTQQQVSQPPAPELMPFEAPGDGGDSTGFNARVYQPSFGVDALDSVGPAADAPLHSLAQISAASGDKSEGYLAQPLPEENDDGFGAFVESGKVEREVLEESPIESSGVEPTEPVTAGLDAFDALGPPADEPIPSLGQSTTDVKDTTTGALDIDDEDGFGEFEGFADEQGPVHVEPALDAEVTVVSTGDLVPQDKSNTMYDPSTVDSQNRVVSGSSFDAFDALGQVEDALLPSFPEAARTEPSIINDNNLIDADDFGDFNDAPDLSVPQEAALSDEAGPNPSDHLSSTAQVSFQLSTSEVELTNRNLHLSKEDSASAFRSNAKDDDLSRPVGMGHVDSAYFSARTQSGLSSFEDAIEFERPTITNELQNPSLGPHVSSAVGEVIDDPFAGFEDISAPPPILESFSRAENNMGGDSDEDVDGFVAVVHQDPQASHYVASGDFDSTFQWAPNPPTGDDDDFGDFAGFSSEPESSGVHGAAGREATANNAAQSAQDVPDAQEFKAPMQPVSVDEELLDDDFGDFGGFEAAPTSIDYHQPIVQGHSAAFGDVEAVHSSAPDATPIDIQGDDNFGDFGEFEGISASVPVEEPTPAPAVASRDAAKLIAISDKISDLARGLPNPLKYRADGSIIDYGSVFEGNIGMDAALSLEREERAKRCFLILVKLTTSDYHSKLAATYWSSAMSVIKEEIAKGTKLLAEASGLSPKEFAASKQQLEAFAHGLREFVRISRSITATVGDLLMLSPNDLFTIDTMASSWQSVPILDDALQVEASWRVFEDKRSKLGLAENDGGAHGLESLSAMRSVSATHADPGNWDDFTLQPLGMYGTKSSVQYGQKMKMMACSGNFLVHHCPFFTEPSAA